MVVNCGSITLNNGKVMPRFGLGTWLSEPGKVKAAVEAAIDAGYRHIDCAFCYQNETEVGEAIANKIKEGVVKREELFVTGKLWNTFHRPENVEQGLEYSLKDLKLDYLDLYLIHWPTAFELNQAEPRNPFPQTPEGINLDDEAHYVGTWKKLEEIYKKGDKLKAIGVSNFNPVQLKKLIAESSVVPQMQQIEIHGYENMEEMVKLCHEHKIQVTAYSPLGNPGRPAGLQKGQDVLMEDPVVKEIAAKHNKSTAQVLIKWVLQRDIVCIPKSVTPSRIVSNSEIFDFTISDEDMAKIMGLNRGIKYVYPDRFEPSKYFPFNKENKSAHATNYSE